MSYHPILQQNKVTNVPTEHDKKNKASSDPMEWTELAQEYLQLWQEFYGQALKDPSLYEAWGNNPANLMATATTGGTSAFAASSMFGMAQFAEFNRRLRALEERFAILERQMADFVQQFSDSKP